MNAYQRKISRLRPHAQAAFRFYVAIMASFGFPVSARYNSLHGPIALCALIAVMAFTRSCGNAASKLLTLRVSDRVDDEELKKMHLPTSQWALSIFGSLGHDAMEASCKGALHACIGAARARGMIPKHPVGMIDGHGSSYYGKKGDMSFFIKSKSKNGTTTYDMFLSSAVRAGPHVLHTAACRMCRGVPMAEYLGKILAQNREAGILCSHWLLDRLFFNVAAMCELGNANEHFLMYARMTPGIKKALAEYTDGKRAAVSEYTVKSGRGRRACDRFTGILAFVEKTEVQKDGTTKNVIIPFFSNLEMSRLEKALHDLSPEMKKRWMHETAFRVAKLSKPMTTSNNPSIRTHAFESSLLLENLWAMANYEAEAERRKEDGEAPLPKQAQDEGLGDTRYLRAKTKYNMDSKEFLSLIVSEGARLLTMDKPTQDEYVRRAVEKHAEALSPMTGPRPVTTGAGASGLPHWA